MLLRRCDSFDLYGCWEFSATLQTTVWLSAALCSPLPGYLDVRAAHRGPLGIKWQFRTQLSKRRRPSSLVHHWMSDSDFCVFIFSGRTSETPFPVVLEGDFAGSQASKLSHSHKLTYWANTLSLFLIIKHIWFWECIMQADSQHMMIDNFAEAFVKIPKSFQRLPPDSSARAETAKTSHSFSLHRWVSGAGDRTGEREGRGREEVVGKWKWAAGRWGLWVRGEMGGGEELRERGGKGGNDRANVSAWVTDVYEYCMCD